MSNDEAMLDWIKTIDTWRNLRLTQQSKSKTYINLKKFAINYCNYYVSIGYLSDTC